MPKETRVLIVGDGPVAEALALMTAAVGWTPVVVVDLDGVEAGLPSADAVVVLSHHDGLDGPAISAALRAGTPYVGAMGSRQTQSRRRDWLVADGLSEDALAALRAPVGLDLGAEEPGEIAVSILAEIVAVRRGAADAVGSLSAREGAIHRRPGAGETACPGR